MQVNFSNLSAIIAVKTLGKAFEAVRDKGVPIVWVSVCDKMMAHCYVECAEVIADGQARALIG